MHIAATMVLKWSAGTLAMPLQPQITKRGFPLSLDPSLVTAQMQFSSSGRWYNDFALHQCEPLKQTSQTVYEIWVSPLLNTSVTFGQKNMRLSRVISTSVPKMQTTSNLLLKQIFGGIPSHLLVLTLQSTIGETIIRTSQKWRWHGSRAALNTLKSASAR